MKRESGQRADETSAARPTLDSPLLSLEPSKITYSRLRDRAWFEHIYEQAAKGEQPPPWSTGVPNRHLVRWWESHAGGTTSGRALVVGCGYGEDAVWLSAQGLEVVGIDISMNALRQPRRKSAPGVQFVVADIEGLPFRDAAFGLVADVYTMQCLEQTKRPSAARAMAGAMASNGTLLVIATKASGHVERDAPWTLTSGDLELFSRSGLIERTHDEFADPDFPHLRRIVASYVKPPTRSSKGIFGAELRARDCEGVV